MGIERSNDVRGRGDKLSIAIFYYTICNYNHPESTTGPTAEVVSLYVYQDT
jgi:hypothetical protein